jgi:hypothetical protein
MSVTGKTGGVVLTHCHADCPIAEVLHAAGTHANQPNTRLASKAAATS